MNFNIPIEMPRTTHYGNNYFVVYSNKLHRIYRFSLISNIIIFLSLEIKKDLKRNIMK